MDEEPLFLLDKLVGNVRLCDKYQKLFYLESQNGQWKMGMG